MKETKWKYELGQELKDKVSGFTGIVCCRADYLTGCKHYSLQGKADKDNKMGTWESFEESRLEPTGASVDLSEPKQIKPPSGPAHPIERW